MDAFCLALLLPWERSGTPWCLVVAGLAFGQAVHTHPTALAVAPGLAIWAALSWRRLLTTRSPYGAMLAFIASLARLIVSQLGRSQSRLPVTFTIPLTRRLM